MKYTNNFSEIYNQYGKMVYNVTLNYLQNLEDAEEATQDVFVKIHQKIEGFNQKSSLKTWIYRITINHCLDVIKSKNRRLRALFSRQIEDNGVIEFYHPGVELENQEAVAQILKEINRLPVNQKTALLLKSIEGLSQKEIAEIMKMKEKAIESLLTRARANLKIRLRK
jgi:RNA polymerase sigma-70 factor (ECF subfamily)